MRIRVEQQMNEMGEYEVQMNVIADETDVITNTLFWNIYEQAFRSRIWKSFSTQGEAEEWRDGKIIEAKERYQFNITYHCRDNFVRSYEVELGKGGDKDADKSGATNR